MGYQIDLTVEDLSPVSFIPRDHYFVILRSYFDGGNEPDSTQYDVVSLASISGTIDQWRQFDIEWIAMLQDHKAPWLHTTDLVSLAKEPFTKESGWTVTRRDRFLSTAVTVIEKHMANPGLSDRKLGHPGLLPQVVTIHLKDFIRAREDNTELPKDVTVLCVTQSIAEIFRRGTGIGAKWFHLVFDQNEPYRGHIEDRRTNKRARKQLGEIVDRITSNIPADMRNVPSLQAADLFAWCYSHRTPLYQWQRRLLKHRRWVDDYYGYNALIKTTPGVASIVQAWGLPKRKATR